MEKYESSGSIGYRPVFKRVTRLEWERYSRKFNAERLKFEAQKKAGQYERTLSLGETYYTKENGPGGSDTNSRSNSQRSSSQRSSSQRSGSQRSESRSGSLPTLRFGSRSGSGLSGGGEWEKFSAKRRAASRDRADLMDVEDGFDSDEDIDLMQTTRR